jgi:hypothetical protein
MRVMIITQKDQPFYLHCQTKKENSMKTRKSFAKRVLLASAFVFATAFLVTSCDKDNDDDDVVMYNISGDASGSQVVPAVNGNGSATMNGTYNASTREFMYTTNWSNLSGAPAMSGFYTGASGVNGTAVGTPWQLGSNLTGTGTYTGTMTLTPAQATELTNGNWYYSYGTSQYPAGEVRGQMTAAVQ